MTHKTFETFSNVLRTQANLWIASRDAGPPSRHGYQTSQAKNTKFWSKNTARGPAHQQIVARGPAQQKNTAWGRTKSKNSSNVRFSGLTRGNSAHRSDRKPEESQRIDQNQPKSRSDRPGCEEKPYGRRLADLGDLYQAARVPWSVRALPG